MSDYLLLLSVFAVLALYPFINRFIQSDVHTLSSSLDSKIPFVPFSILPYLSFFLLIVWSLAVFLVEKERLYRQMCYSIIVVSLVSYSIYLSYQTRMTRPIITGFGLFDNLVSFVYRIDPPYSSFPSLHSSLSTVIAFLWFRSASKVKYLVLCWSVIIILSTLMVKQHHILDVLGGITLGIVISAVVMKVYNAFENTE